jgi:MFS family permease
MDPEKYSMEEPSPSISAQSHDNLEDQIEAEAGYLSKDHDIDIENNADTALSKPITLTHTHQSVIGRTLSLVRTRESGRDPGPPPDGGLNAWMQVLYAHLVIANTWGYINSYGVFQTYYTETLGVSASAVSWVGSIQIFLLFFIGTFSGRATDAGYFKFVWTAGAVIELVGIFMASLCTKYWQLFLSQGLAQGIGCGLMFCPTLALMPTYFDRNRALAFGIAATGSATGGIIFPAVVMRLLPQIGYAWTMRVLGFITLASQIPSFIWLRQRLPPRKAGPIVEWSAFKEAPYTLFAIGMFLNFWGLYVGFFYIGSFAHNILHIPNSLGIDLLMVMNGVGFIGRILPAWIADRYTGPMNLLIPSALGTAVLAYAWYGVQDLSGLYVFAVIYGLFAAGIQALFPSTLSSLTTDLSKAGVRMGMVMSVVSVATLTGSPIGGALIEVDSGGKSYLYAQMFMGSAVMAGAFTLLASRVTKVGWRLARC